MRSQVHRGKQASSARQPQQASSGEQDSGEDGGEEEKIEEEAADSHGEQSEAGASGEDIEAGEEGEEEAVLLECANGLCSNEVGSPGVFCLECPGEVGMAGREQRGQEFVLGFG